MNHTSPQTLSVNIGDTDLQYLYYHGREPAVILLHATGFLPWLWHPIAAELSGDYRVLAPYFCDHRDTDPVKGGLNWMKLAEDLCQFCEKLNLASPVLVGHSMGATVMAIAEATHGPRAAGMILIEPIFLPRDYYRMQIRLEDHPLASRSIRRRNFWEDSASARQYLKGRGMFKKWDDAFLDLYIQYGMKEASKGGLTLTCSPEKEASLFMGGMGYDPWPMLPKIKCPALVLEGSESENRQFVDLRAGASALPNGAYRLIDGAGHLIPMEKPAKIIEIIRRFIRSLE
ncbi:MAG: alpha/beta hydrolase [Deltaproteobacteria bacterium]|jgi:pimeloyl-ACP methyl ester carboxylesterase